MAKQTRYGYSNRNDDDEQRPSRRAKTQTSSPVVPLAILLGMIIGAVILARGIAGKKDDKPVEAAPTSSDPQPFADYTEEPPKPRESSGRGGTYKPAPSGLADSNPDWGRALAIAAEADVLFKAAQDAKAADDTTLFLQKGKAAKEKYDEAAIMTAVWEEELLELYGERDRQVRDITRARTDWLNRIRFLHKSTGR